RATSPCPPGSTAAQGGCARPAEAPGTRVSRSTRAWPRIVWIAQAMSRGELGNPGEIRRRSARTLGTGTYDGNFEPGPYVTPGPSRQHGWVREPRERSVRGRKAAGEPRKIRLAVLLVAELDRPGIQLDRIEHDGSGACGRTRSRATRVPP